MKLRPPRQPAGELDAAARLAAAHDANAFERSAMYLRLAADDVDLPDLLSTSGDVDLPDLLSTSLNPKGSQP